MKDGKIDATFSESLKNDPKFDSSLLEKAKECIEKGIISFPTKITK